MKALFSLLLIVSVGVPPALVFGQTPSAQDQDDVVRVRSNEVRLDVVVKDKKGRPIRDLKAGDFEVLEDGVPQKVESFRFVTREGGLSVVIPEAKDNKSAPAPTTNPTA